MSFEDAAAGSGSTTLFSHGGDTGASIGQHDWARTSIGPAAGWPSALRTALQLVLSSPFPMVLAWGPDLLTFHNDAYRTLLGDKPDALGRPLLDVWHEVRHKLDPLAQRALSGEACRYIDAPFTILRGGRPEEAFFDFSFSPVRNETGVVVGLLNVAVESTDRVLAERRAAAERERLRESETRYRQIVEGADDFAIVTLNGHGIITGWNTGAERITGYSEPEALGQSGDIIFTPEDRKAGAPDHELNRAHAEGRALNERWHERKDGSRFWGSGLTMRLDPDEGYLKIFRDRTVEHEAEAAVRASEARFRLMADAVPQIVWITDAEGRVEFFNKQWSDYTGMPYEPTTASQVAADHVHPDDAEATVAAFTEAMLSGTTFLVEHRIRSKEGAYRWFLVRGEPQLDPGTGKILRWFGASVDIHDRRQAEAALRESEARLRQFNDTLESQVAERTAERDRMWETSPDLMLVIDFEGVFRRVNPAWTSILGFDPGELVGHHVNEFVLPDDHGPTTDAYKLAARGGHPSVLNRYRHKDGSVRWISWVAAPYGSLTYATGRDVTIEHQQQVELERAQDALRQSQKMEAVGQLTGGLAHDFNNLLAGISGSLDMMQTRLRQGRVGDIDRYMVGAQGAAKRAAALTHRLLAFSRRQTLDPKPTDMIRLIAGMEDLIQRTVGPAVNVETVAPEGIWPTLVDPNQLENALLNLCINARDAMPDGGRIKIQTTNHTFDEQAARKHDLPRGQYVSMCVSDTGSGMTPDVVEKAFDPFFTTKPLGVGTGLGLSMIYGFARQSGGQVRIESEVERGTTVCLYLPRHDEDEAVEAKTDNASLPSSTRGKSVLVVDDEPLVRMLVVDAVEDLGHTPLEAGDGPQAMKVLRSSVAIDLLITDVGLPNGMNGRQVADAARELRPGLKVMFVTGYAENAVLSHGDLESGMEVITKPFDMTVLLNRIQAMVTDRPYGRSM